MSEDKKCFDCETSVENKVYVRLSSTIFLCWNCQLKVQKAYETKMMPLKFQNKEGRHFDLLPPNAERELRRKLIEGDKMFVEQTEEELED